MSAWTNACGKFPRNPALTIMALVACAADRFGARS